MAPTGDVVNTEKGYSLTLPLGWLRIDENTDFGQLLGPEKEAELEAILRQTSELGVSLIAIDLASANTNFLTSLTILDLPTLGFDLDALEAVNLSQVTRVALDGKVQHSRVELPAGEAIHFIYKVKDPDSGTVYVVRQYLLVNGTTQTILTISAAKSDEAAAADAEAIANSFLFLPVGFPL